MPTFKLTYFNAKGRAELIRLIFAASGVKYTDETLKNWPNGKEDAPIGQLPYLTVDGVKLAQSISIARFVAKRCNLVGANDIEEAQTDAIVDTTNDLQVVYYSKIFPFRKIPEKFEEIKKKYLAEDGQTCGTRLEKLIQLYGSNGYSVGTGLKWSDLAIYNTMSLYVLNLDSKFVDNYPGILKVNRIVESNEKVKEYLSKRPKTAF